MWQKMFRDKYPSKTYRKRYKCPECQDYTLHIEHDSFAECEEGCEFISSELLIFEIFEEDDFSGYYITEEIKEAYIDIEENVQDILNSVRKGAKYKSIYSPKQIDRMNKSFEKSVGIDELLTDFDIKYFRKYPKRKTQIESLGLNDIEILLDLIEDTHFFINKTLNELVLFEFAVDRFDDRRTHSGWFFLYNSKLHTIGAWERVINVLAILFGVEYDNDNMRENSFWGLHSKLKRNEEFKGTNAFKLLNNLRGSQFFKKVAESRQRNDHDISEHVSLVLSVAANKPYDPNYNFALELIPDCDDILKNAETLLSVLEESITMFEKVVLNDNQIVINDCLKQNYFSDLNKIRNDIDELKPISFDVGFKNFYDEVSTLIERIEVQRWRFDSSKTQHKFDYFREIYQYHTDIIFRLHEISRCFFDYGRCLNGSIVNDYPFPDFIINKEYFVYAAIYRTYSCLDKMGKSISKLFGIVHNKDHYYFEDLITNSQSKEKLKNTTLFEMINNLFANNNFKVLSEYRNNIFHNMRPGTIYGTDLADAHEQIMIYSIYRNCSSILLVINELNNEIIKKFNLK
jgi:hypothetical protein